MNLRSDLVLQNADAGSSSDGRVPMCDWSQHVAEAGPIEVIFDGFVPRLLGLINHFDMAIGCVAWLTHFEILLGLASMRHAQIVVQKEDFLRPDLDVRDRVSWKRKLRFFYGRLRCELTRYQMRYDLAAVSYAHDLELEPVRCVGNHNQRGAPAFPRMHHKFLVFCDITEDGYQPRAVWTGSFNLTDNATRSLENVIVLRHPEILEAYCREYEQIAARSESLDWQNSWAAPEWRIGT